MSIAFAFVFLGALLIVAGWKNVSLASAARGDATQPKPTVTAGGAALTST